MSPTAAVGPLVSTWLWGRPLFRSRTVRVVAMAVPRHGWVGPDQPRWKPLATPALGLAAGGLTMLLVFVLSARILKISELRSLLGPG